MTKIKVIIVDDEPRAHKVLEHYIARMPELELCGNFLNAIEARSFLQNNRVNLLLLDITMPEVNGFAFLKMLDKPPFVIFSTAHSRFALKSYEFNAVDYLKKPFRFERFEKAIHKLGSWIEKGLVANEDWVDINLRIGGSNRCIPFKDILYLQSFGNYVKIYQEENFLVTEITTKEIESMLPRSVFLRIHKSYIVNISRIDTIIENEILVNNNRLPIGKTFRKYLQSLIASRQ